MQTDARFGDPGAFALRAFGGFAQLGRAELESAFFASGGVDARLVFGMFEGLKQVREVFGGIFSGLFGEAGDFGDGHGMVEEHGNEVFAEHAWMVAASRGKAQ